MLIGSVPKVLNRASAADLAVEFIKPGSEEAAEINKVLLKETEKPKYLPMQIVELMQAEGYPRFTSNKHAELWKALKAKDPGKNYGAQVFGKQWAWYESWVNRVREHCQENADRYGPLVERAAAADPQNNKKQVQSVA